MTSADHSSHDGDTGSGRSGAALVERAIVVVSVLLIAGMLGYVFWQASSGPSTPDPAAEVASVESRQGSEQQSVTVTLTNTGDTGLSTVWVSVRCGDRAATLEFTHVAGGARRTGTVICPAGTTPEASVQSWIKA